MKKIALKRGSPNICAYARSFDYRNVDTKIMREVYIQVQEWLGKYNGVPFPVQAEDSFENTYRMDPDTLDEIYWEVADNLEICTDDQEKNPHYDYEKGVKTVKELVLFLHHQHRVDSKQ